MVRAPLDVIGNCPGGAGVCDDLTWHVRRQSRSEAQELVEHPSPMLFAEQLSIAAWMRCVVQQGGQSLALKQLERSNKVPASWRRDFKRLRHTSLESTAGPRRKTITTGY